MTGTPSTFPITKLPTCPSAVEDTKPGISRYGKDTESSKSSAKAPRPLPNTSAIFASTAVRVRIARAAISAREYKSDKAGSTMILYSFKLQCPTSFSLSHLTQALTYRAIDKLKLIGHPCVET